MKKNDYFVKPPIGVKPRWLHDESWMNENYPICSDWVNEYNELVARLRHEE